MSVSYLLVVTSANAETPAAGTPLEPVASPIETAQTTGNLDGVYLFVGPTGGTIHAGGEWDSSIGGHLSIATYSEHRALTLAAIDLGLTQVGREAGGRAWITPSVGSRVAGSLVVFSAGLSAQWDPVEPPKLGPVATIGWFVGVLPTLSVGRHQRSGTFVEVGLRLTLPALRFSRQGLL